MFTPLPPSRCLFKCDNSESPLREVINRTQGCRFARKMVSRINYSGNWPIWWANRHDQTNLAKSCDNEGQVGPFASHGATSLHYVKTLAMAAQDTHRLYTRKRQNALLLENNFLISHISLHSDSPYIFRHIFGTEKKLFELRSGNELGSELSLFDQQNINSVTFKKQVLQMQSFNKESNSKLKEYMFAAKTTPLEGNVPEVKTHFS